MKKILMLVLVTLLMSIGSVVYAHSGGTDANGCHVDSRTGVRHCH